MAIIVQVYRFLFIALKMLFCIDCALYCVSIKIVLVTAVYNANNYRHIVSLPDPPVYIIIISGGSGDETNYWYMHREKRIESMQ